MKSALMMSRTIWFAVVVMVGCGGEPPPLSVVDPRDNPLFEAAPRQVTSLLTGYALDPEVYSIAFASCPPPCMELAPFVSDFLPPFSSSMVGGANISVVNAMTGGAVGTSGTSGMFDGVFSVDGIPSDPTALYLVASDGAGALISPPFGPPPPAPTTYNPTVTLRPLAAGGSAVCVMIESAQIGSNGVLEAVAKKIGLTVTDLLDPAQFQAITVFWSLSPGPFFIRIPAMGIGYSASVGQVYLINWAPPGTLDPAIQSERGFFVDESAPGSALGVAVGVVSASETLAGPILYQGSDPVLDPMFGRPYAAPPVPVFPSPGKINSVPLMFFPGGPPPDASEGGGPPPTPDFMCSPVFEGPPPGP